MGLMYNMLDFECVGHKIYNPQYGIAIAYANEERIIETPILVALIALGGALFVALANHRLQLWREKRAARVAACAKLRAAFDSVLAQIYLVQNRGNSNYGSTDEAERESIAPFVKNALFAHAAAVEEFRPFVASNRHAAYQEAWESYRKLANERNPGTAEDWMTDTPGGSALEKRIHAILLFAKT